MIAQAWQSQFAGGLPLAALTKSSVIAARASWRRYSALARRRSARGRGRPVIRLTVMQRLSAGRLAVIVLGTGVWLAGGWTVAASISSVRARATRETVTIELVVEPAHGLSIGDGVFTTGEAGLRRIGEVSSVDEGAGRVLLAITPARFAGLTESTTAQNWRTPLTAEDALNALLPPRIQSRAAERIARAWRDRETEILAAWKPIAKELASGYLDVISNDLEAALRNREDAIWQIARTHGSELTERWPRIYNRLSPILQRHLTPVLGRLMEEAIGDAPKGSIAWSVFRGRNEKAFRQMLDWLTQYLADMPEKDKAEMRAALQRTWSAALDDPALMAQLTKLGRQVRDDEELRNLLAEVYREAVSENPRTAEFIRAELLESPRIQAEVYRFVDLFAPTARSVAAMCLIDEQGVTRPEVVHLVRSIALRRDVAWVTLATRDEESPMLAADAKLVATPRGAAR